MQFVSPFFWQPKGIVTALEHLPPSGQVLRQSDVTLAVSGKASSPHPLMVTALAGGKIIGDLKLVATSDDVVIGDMQSVFGRGIWTNYPASHRRRFRLPKYRRGTALLLGAANSDNYYHWLVDSLPRWRILQAAGWQEYDYVLLHSQPCRFQEETLDWVGVPAHRRLRCSKNFIHQFERLVVPVMPVERPVAPVVPFAHNPVPTWVAHWLRSLAPPAPSGPEKIYLSRRGTPRRRFASEAELMPALAARGFVAIQPETLSVVDQVRCLGSARWIVAPHGAALANMVFAPPGARVMELFHPQHKNRCYKNLAAACGHSYASLEGQAINRADEPRLEYRIGTTAVLENLDRMEASA